MEEFECSPHLIRYFCTAGSGMEGFLLSEVKDKLEAESVEQIPGKVFFSSSVAVPKIIQLKAAERLFLLLMRGSSLTDVISKRPAKAASSIQSRLIGNGKEWSEAVMTWRRLQRAIVDDSVRSLKPATVLDKKRKRETDDEQETTADVGELTSGNDKSNGTLPPPILEPGRVPEPAEPHPKALSDSGTAELPEKDAVEHNTTGSDGDERLAAPVSFRVSCRCSGALSRRFGPQDLSQTIGTGLSRQLGWRVDLKNPELEVNVHLSDDHTILGIPLLRSPLASRSYIQTTGLRSTVAWVMSSLAGIQPGSCVLDPMCGVGTILLEAAQEHQDSYFLGVDIDDRQVLRANENAAFAGLADRVHLVQASSLGLPIPSSSVDAVICDVPFGKKFGTKTNMAASLLRIVTEMERVLCVSGTLVLLLSPQLSVLLKSLQGSPAPAAPREVLDAGVSAGLAPPLSSLKLHSTHRIGLGAIDGLIMKYVKSRTV